LPKDVPTERILFSGLCYQRVVPMEQKKDKPFFCSVGTIYGVMETTSACSHSKLHKTFLRNEFYISDFCVTNELFRWNKRRQTVFLFRRNNLWGNGTNKVRYSFRRNVLCYHVHYIFANVGGDAQHLSFIAEK
jgi:hypothetical protein